MSNELMYIPWPGWEKVRKIGEGSFGTVYEIKHDLIKGEERAALKVLSIPRNESEIKSMRAEGQDVESITQTIKDQAGNVEEEYKSMLELEGAPNIVRCNGVYSNAHKDGLGYDIYIMMELLTPLLDQVNNLIETESHIVQFGIDMCHALVACEKKGILHRDIKPENVFVSRDGIFKLGDFGVARSLDHTTYATKGVGTAPYMAPEIANGNEYNKQADIYSLGIMLYWLLNKRRTPFLPLPPEGIRTSDRENAFRRRCDGEQIPEPVDGSKELKRIVLKACAFNLADRYQSAQDMLEDLQDLMDPVPVRMIPRIIKTDTKEKTVSPREYTDGPNRQSSSDEGHIPTRGPDEEWLEKQKKQKELVQQKKRQQLFKIIAGVIGAAFVILLILLLLRSCSGDVPQGTDDTTPSESTVDTIPVESSTEETIPPGDGTITAVLCTMVYITWIRFKWHTVNIHIHSTTHGFLPMISQPFRMSMQVDNHMPLVDNLRAQHIVSAISLFGSETQLEIRICTHTRLAHRNTTSIDGRRSGQNPKSV